MALDVSLPSLPDPAQAAALAAAVHEVCPYSAATRGNIDVALTANGRPVGRRANPYVPFTKDEGRVQRPGRG